jgi:hypothetical protein
MFPGGTMSGIRGLWAIGLVAILLVAAGAARADVIDGDWCHAQDGHFAIKGPEIVTPGGHKLQGSYTRHSFAYTVPAPEPGAGEEVAMTLVNENTVHLRRPPTAPIQVWVRCAPRVS